MNLIFRLLISPFVFIGGGAESVIFLFSKPSTKTKANCSINEYPNMYEWHNHVSIPSEELEAMAIYRRQIVIPELIKVLNGFLGSKHEAKMQLDSIHGDRIEIVEKYGDGYIVAHIFIRGYGCIAGSDFTSGGPRTICGKCGASYRIDDYKEHTCGEKTFDTINPDDFQKTIKTLGELADNVRQDSYDIKKALKTLDALTHKDI